MTDVAPDLSVVIPVYNRGELIRYTLESVRRASTGLRVETIIVDDGSTEPAAASIARLGFAPTKIVRQENQGLLFARLTGLREVTGRHTLFLDSDDLVSPGKFRAQIAAMDAAGTEISYSDTARATIEGDYDRLAITVDAPAEETRDGAEFFIRVQPAPHSPIWRTTFLQRAVAQAFIPTDPLYNFVAEIWFYHNAAPLGARVVKVAGPHTIVGLHPGARLTNHWERLAVASLAVMESFARHCPDTPAAQPARQLVAEKAFTGWRGLPRDFSAEFERRELAIWRRLAREKRLEHLGGPAFQLAARLLGPELAGRIFRRRIGPYAACRTLNESELKALLARLPAT